MRPISQPRYLERQLKEAHCFRISRRDIDRQLVFIPAVVLKIGMARREQHRLALEAQQSQQAAQHPFWKGEALRSWRIWGVGNASRRLRPARVGDYDRVRAFVDQRLKRSVDFDRVSMSSLVAANPLHAQLDTARRVALDRALADNCLPRTSMHGDLHLFNFAIAEDQLFVFDWEHFEADGSFVFDAIDFEMANVRENSRESWADFLARLEPDEEAIASVTERLDLEAKAVLLYYLVAKTAILTKRHGIASRKSAPFLANMSRQIDRLAA
jgi:hypothetical protein